MEKYFDESYESYNNRWRIDIKKEKDYIIVCILNNCLRPSRIYSDQYCIKINKYGFDGHYKTLPKYIQKELKNIQTKYFK